MARERRTGGQSQNYRGRVGRLLDKIASCIHVRVSSFSMLPVTHAPYATANTSNLDRVPTRWAAL